MPKKKKKWLDMQITRVKLNPEQAVLACCVLPGRGAYAAGYLCRLAACGDQNEANRS